MRNNSILIFLIIGFLTTFSSAIAAKRKSSFDSAEAAHLETWDTPYIQAIDRLINEKWEQSSLTIDRLKSESEELWKFLKRKNSDWKPLLNNELSLLDLMHPRQTFAAKDYVSVVYATKPGTLVFQLKTKPHIVVKIDNRDDSSFDHKYRSYMQALVKSKGVQKSSFFSRLFFPLELGRVSSVENVDVIFSEKIPLFSEAEIDNRILLHLLLTSAVFDQPPGPTLQFNSYQAQLRQAIKNLYLQMIEYICKADFDDINYRNLPFTVDGRLSPFDTDSLLANTGVRTFLRLFFGYKVLSLRAVKAALQSCSPSYAENPQNIEELYKDHAAEDEIFANNDEAIAKIGAFLNRQLPSGLAKAKLADSFKSALDEERQFAEIIDSVIARRLFENESLNLQEMRNNGRLALQNAGKRCMHIADFVNEVHDEAKFVLGDTMTDQQFQSKTSKMLRSANFQGIVYIKGAPTKSLASGGQIEFMNDLAILKDLRAYLCF